MAIEVKCPQGHRLSCPDERAGSKGKCPKCGETFEVPKANGKPPAADSAEAPEPEEQIVFLCPNGHKLNGPASLQGKPGQCPHCGLKFKIPIYEDEDETDEGFEAAEEVGEELSFDTDTGATDGEIGKFEELEEIEEIDALGEMDELEEIEEFADPLMPPPPVSVGDNFLPGDLQQVDRHPLARLFATLWAERQHGGIVEIQLAERDRIVPDWWARGLSTNSFGVFALQTADGSYTMETIPWNDVKRITVRQIKELPDGVFE